MRSLLGRFHRPMSRGLVNNMLTMNNLGDGSTLSLDFTTMGGVLDPRLTFTRSTTATYINSSGYVTSAAINDPRFDYSHTNIGEPRGLLIEGQATNLTKFSETFTNAYWNTTANNVTAADSVATSPTGVALTASTLTEIAGTVSRHVHQLVGEFTPAASTAYTMSCFVKQPTSNAIRYVQLVFWSAGFGLTAYMNYDLQTGTVGTGGAGITASSITQYPNGWYRITARATSVAVPGVSGFQLGFSTTSGAVRTESYTASAPLKSIQLFGAQVELGSGASSYIPTGASQVTRNPDYLLSTSSGARTEFSIDDLAAGTSALNAHTVLWTYGRDPNSKQQFPTSLYARTNANTERIDFRDFTGTTVEAGTQTRTVQAVTVGTASIVKIALAQSTSAYPSSAINGTSATLTSGVIDSALGLQWVQLCNSGAVASSFNPIWARQLKVYPTQLTAAQLQTLTTL